MRIALIVVVGVAVRVDDPRVVAVAVVSTGPRVVVGRAERTVESHSA